MLIALLFALYSSTSRRTSSAVTGERTRRRTDNDGREASS